MDKKCFNCKKELTRLQRPKNDFVLIEICQNKDCYKYIDLDKVENWQKTSK